MDNMDATTAGFSTYVGRTRRRMVDSDFFVLFDDWHSTTESFEVVEFAHPTHDSLGSKTLALNEMMHRNECSICHALLPSSHLLDLHFMEVHDSFFAAQASRNMPVYRCLVESCSTSFQTIQERRKHLIGYHRFDKTFHWDRMHLRRKKSKIRPASGSTSLAKQNVVGTTDVDNNHGCTSMKTGDVPCMNDSIMEEVSDHVSRLSLAAQSSHVPRAIAFGRPHSSQALIFQKHWTKEH